MQLMITPRKITIKVSVKNETHEKINSKTHEDKPYGIDKTSLDEK